MSEGTARELVARAIEGVLLSGGAPRCRELAEMAAKHVVEDLTEAGALAPAGLTERAQRIEREANAVVDAVTLLIEYKQENGYWNDTEMDLAAAAEKHMDALHEALEAADAATAGLTRTVTCGPCQGSGGAWSECPVCNGTGASPAADAATGAPS